MRSLILGFLLLSNGGLHAENLVHPTCQIYLPTGSKISSYSEDWKIPLQKRGYAPVERDVDQLKNELQAGDLMLTLSMEYKINRIAPNICTIAVTLQQRTERSANADLTSAKVTQRSFGHTIHCEKAISSALHEFPKCVKQSHIEE